MRIRRLLDRARPAPSARPLELYAHPDQVVAPEGVTEITLDLAVVVETGQAVLVLGSAALAAAGITAHPTLRTSSDPVGPLRLLATAGRPVPVPTDIPVAIGLVLDAPAETFYEDTSIDAAMAVGGLRFTDLER